MSLKEQFGPDLDPVFFNPEEFGEICTDPETGEVMDGRRFEIIENGVKKVFTTKCVWDKYAVHTRLIVQQQGVYLGDVMWFVAKSCFMVAPKPDEIIYTWEDNLNRDGPPHVDPRRARPSLTKLGYRIIQVIDSEYCYEIALDKLIG